MAITRKTPAIPDVPPGMDEATASVLRPTKEVVETLAGVRGDPLDRAATLRDLVALGIITTDQAGRV